MWEDRMNRFTSSRSHSQSRGRDGMNAPLQNHIIACHDLFLPTLSTPNAQLIQLEDQNMTCSNNASQFSEDEAVGALLKIANPNGSSIHSSNLPWK
jgi:hypothetical protein